ncbi:MAG: hypothetical protein JWO60_2227 [Frankiales bacterium]|nr:hypothetical protein [Frankiales bacterium]
MPVPARRALAARHLLGLVATVNALRPLTRRQPLALPLSAPGLLVSELPLGVLAVSVARALLRARPGTSAGPRGAAAGVVTAASWAGLLQVHRVARRADGVLQAALVQALGRDHAGRLAPPVPPAGGAARTLGVLAALGVRRTFVETDQAYGPHGRANRLEVWRHRDLPRDGQAPVLLQLPGGGWVRGSRRGQAHPLLGHLAARGWVCVSASYRVSPRHRWPAQVVDAKRALAWVRQEVAAHGGDPSFVAVTGGSAGGHLAALLALTAGDPLFQPGFEDADTSVQACVPLYGRYDWLGTQGPGRRSLVAFLGRVVVGRSVDEVPEVFRAASPLHRVHAGAPPFLVVHGDADTVIPVGEAQEFVAALRAVSRAPVAYAELPGAQHAFELLGSPRARATATAVETFLSWVRARG